MTVADNEQAIADLEARLVVLEQEFQAFAEAPEPELSFDNHTAPPMIVTASGATLPEWSFEIIEGVVEALKGLRIQGALTIAHRLEEKYLDTPSEDPSVSTPPRGFYG